MRGLVRRRSDRAGGYSRWHVSTYHSPTGTPAVWAGEAFATDCGSGDFFGYGNIYKEWLDWYGAVADPSVATTVLVTPCSATTPRPAVTSWACNTNDQLRVGTSRSLGTGRRPCRFPSPSPTPRTTTSTGIRSTCAGSPIPTATPPTSTVVADAWGTARSTTSRVSSTASSRSLDNFTSGLGVLDSRDARASATSPRSGRC